jgi:hypothetical protein
MCKMTVVIIEEHACRGTKMHQEMFDISYLNKSCVELNIDII